jgi:hypothetical protein
MWSQKSWTNRCLSITYNLFADVYVLKPEHIEKKMKMFDSKLAGARETSEKTP